MESCPTQAVLPLVELVARSSSRSVSRFFATVDSTCLQHIRYRKQKATSRA
ncbi:MAG: hypothetical protein ACQESR_09970 [Planctomycetota bacterium]